nr:Fanconi anemia group M protein [Osmia lignaria]
MEPTQNTQVSSDAETKGFDLSAGKTWIYPENYPVRDYQFNIVQACLYKNTLVCLPTGLGKTFIAAVMMYNFWRWYPRGRVVFLAPTKPLVAQQIFACHNIMGISSIESVELTGAINQKQREIAWLKKRVIFATPQVFYNDLHKNIVPADLIKCVVIDEAHKALGKHSYCECIQLLSQKNKNFRVLALSATPGNKIDNVHEVLQNLLIAHVELRDETSPDIIPYINERKVDIILVPLNNELTKYKERYIFVMDRHVKVLLQYNVLKGDTANISKGRIYHLLKDFQNKTNKSGNYGQIIKTLNILMTMYHAYELMIRDGLRAFCKFYQNHSDKFWMNEETQLLELVEDIKQYLGPFPDVKTINESNAANISQDLVFGHTKFEKLKELLSHHFTSSQEKQIDTRAIVFVEYRDIVNEIYVLLLQCQPLIKPQMFVGQAGQKQKQQIKALEHFRSNHVNVLISTSIGEEGLDVGEVDLIVCFDVSQHSPTRLVQRMGRTGRKRDGHIIILVTDGKEHETLKSTMARRVSLNNRILNTSNIFSSLYQSSPRMIPDIFKPECLKMHINVQPKTPVTKGKKKKADKENNKRQNKLKKITALDSDTKSQKDDNKFTMTKFFTTKKYKEHSESNVNTPACDTSQNKNIIKPSDVKILSCDNDAVDFLTTCALRTSEKETDTEEECKINKIYIPKFPRIKNLFKFTVPNIKILDCLISLEDVVPLNSNLHKNKNRSKSKSNLCNDEPVFDNEPKQKENERIIEKSKFEDLLDNSSESKESDIINNEDLEPGIFEDILNEISDECESNIHVENIQAEQSQNKNDKRIVEDNSISNSNKSKNEQILSITQAIEEIAKLNTNSSNAKVIDESEDDMFQDEDFLREIDNIEETIKEADNLSENNESNNKTVFNDWTDLDQWDDDFEIPMEPVCSSTKFNLSKGTNKKSKQPVKTLDWDSEEWISADKPSNVSRGSTSDSSIAKKLSNVRKNWNSSSKQFIKCNLNDSTKREEEKESSFFFNHSKVEDSSRERRSKEEKSCQKRIHGNRKRRKIHEFIEDEAKVSSNEVSSDESSEMDTDLDDFVSYTQNVHDTTDMHIHYLKSVKSPMKARQGFVFKEPRTVDTSIEIYSQAPEQDDTYLNDSFCVEGDENEHQDITLVKELCELERAERELEGRKRKGKRKRSKNEALDCKTERRSKRKNYRNSSNSSSEDEIENLRKQIMDTSKVSVQ